MLDRSNFYKGCELEKIAAILEWRSVEIRRNTPKFSVVKMDCCDLDPSDQILPILNAPYHPKRPIVAGTQSVFTDQQTGPRN